MYCITAKELIEELQELPEKTVISSIGFGHDSNGCYLVLNDERCKSIKEVPLRWRENFEGGV